MSFLSPNSEKNVIAVHISFVNTVPVLVCDSQSWFWVLETVYVMRWYITVHQKLHKIPIPYSFVFMANQPLSLNPHKIWILHLCGTNSISSSNKPNEYICGTLQCICRHQRGKPFNFSSSIFQSWISCCLDHFSLCFYSNAASRLVKAYWLKLLKEPFICFSLMFNATRHSGA